MSTLQIRNLPEDVYQALSLRAEREHRSLAQQAIIELRNLPEVRARQKRIEVLSRIQKELHNATDTLSRSPEVMVREDRDR